MLNKRKLATQLRDLWGSLRQKNVYGDISHIQIKQMRDLWNSLSRKSVFGFISHLQPGQEWNQAEFHLTGIRFVNRMCDRFSDYGKVELSQASVLEIGCGVGRFLKPLACRFKKVHGVDISEEMLHNAAKYCECLPNITLQLNDGRTLKNISNNSFDYCVSAGVFQHITDIDVIISYIKEALRILKPGGLFLFQFEGNRTERIGSQQVGARITAADLDRRLGDVRFKIREISIDPSDAVRCVVIVLQKPEEHDNSNEHTDSFLKYPMTERQWISGVYDDITTKTNMHERQKTPLRLTFYDN